MAGRFRVIAYFDDADGTTRRISAPMSRTKAERIRAKLLSEGFPDMGRPDRVGIADMACDAVTAIAMGAMR